MTNIIQWLVANDPSGEQVCDTGIAARWCARCGTCDCPYDDTYTYSDDCPLHGTTSTHADYVLETAV